MTTYYVDGVDGSDGNAGTSQGSGNAWASISHAMSTISAGDKVYVKGNGNYAEQATISTTGAGSTPVVFEGYTSTPGDGGRATITGSDSRANCVINSASTALYYVFKNFVFTNATAEAVDINGGDYITFYNCIFKDSNQAFFGDNYHLFIKCSFTGMSSSMIVVDNGATFVGCSFSCGGVGAGDDVFLGYNVHMTHCEFYGFDAAVRAVVNVDQHGGPCALVNCTFDGENQSVSGFRTSNSNAIGPHAFVNNIFYDLEYALEGASLNPGESTIMLNNLFNSLTAETLTYDPVNEGKVTTAPGFTDEANDDYTLASGANAEDAGVDAGAAP